MSRPSFSKPKSRQSYSSPEELFSKLQNRKPSHGYLRQPQADVLREYTKLHEKADIALELPTGTGKTAVALLIGEWRRRQSGQKIAYLTLTNQLAKQVLREGQKLNIPCADLTGNKDTRDIIEEGKYKSSDAIAVTTYSNLFNTKPVIQASNLLILDDSHGGQQYVADMWSVKVNKDNYQELFTELLVAIRPTLTDGQIDNIIHGEQYGDTYLAPIHYRDDVQSKIRNILDSVDNNNIFFSWRSIRNNISACILLISPNDITIRPIIPPTFDHPPFAYSNQRVYMSATIGGKGDLERSYCVLDIETIRAQNPQWGRRYIFAPNLYMDDKKCLSLISNLWQKLKEAPRRILLLSPSFFISDKYYNDFLEIMKPTPKKLTKTDIEDDLIPFTESMNAILCLAGRYDGIDLPGDDCRILLLAESPSAIGALEKNLRDQWKLGPILRRKERIRLVQGIGRCTRNSTDFAIVILLGQTIVNSFTTPTLIYGFPEEIQKEWEWGKEQGKIGSDDLNQFEEMLHGLLEDSEYRAEANEIIEDLEHQQNTSFEDSYNELGKLEVKFSQALWNGSYTNAYNFARKAADKISSGDLTGYKAWLYFLASIAAYYGEDSNVEIDSLRQGRGTGVNAGFFDKCIRHRSKEISIPEVNANSSLDIQAENIWNLIQKWGWHGPKFTDNLKEMKNGLELLDNATVFHRGLELLGKCVGAETMRPNEDGDPDVVWIFEDRAYTFEAKTGKKEKSRLSKKNAQQASGHPSWLRNKRTDLNDRDVKPVIIMKKAEIHPSAKPHIRDLYFVFPGTLIEQADDISRDLQSIRTKFVLKEFGESQTEIKSFLNTSSISLNKIDKLLGIKLVDNI